MRDQIRIIFDNMTSEQQARWRKYTREVVDGSRETMTVEFMIDVQNDKDIETDPIDTVKVEAYRDREKESLEFLRAIETYKKENDKLFLAWTEVLTIVESLGYRRPQQ